MSHRVSGTLQQNVTGDTIDTQVCASNAPRRTVAVSYSLLESKRSDPAEGVLAEIRFGATADRPSAPSPWLSIHVALDPLGPMPPAEPMVEVWHADGAVRTGEDGDVRYACDDQRLFAVVEVDERQHGGVLAATEFAYAQVRRFQGQSAYRHLLRMWNYVDAVNQGSGDMERYRQFCVGRARGFGDSVAEAYPAASAVGRQRPTHILQVYWMAARVAGTAVENPRQVSAYRYPQIYGPSSPGFARATIAPDDTLLISGTASIIGHASQHAGNVTAQLDETLRNLDALIAQASRQRSGLQATLSPRTCLKVYARNAAQVAQIDAQLRKRLPDALALYLSADICRRELLLEIECVQAAPHAPVQTTPGA